MQKGNTMGAGDYKKDEFDKDELAALGEVAETAPVAEKTEPIEKEGPEPKEEPKEESTEEPKETPKEEPKAEPTKEEIAAIETKGARFEDGHIIDEDGNKIPLKRFREIYFEAKEGERTKEKLHLLKTLGPDEYYRVHPDEKPADYRSPQQRINPLDLTVQRKVPNVPYQYEGMTLREVMQQDPDEGATLLEDWKAGQQQQVSTKDREIEENAKEAAEFAEIVAREVFSKDLRSMTKEEAESEDGKKMSKAINDLIFEVYKWGAESGKHQYRLVDMWRLKNKADPVKQEKALKSLEQKPVVKSIGSGGGSVGQTGFEAYEAMSEDELTTKLDGMKDKELKEFYKKAPASLRKKYPSIPWD